jgi:hypothetical protein
MFVTISAGNQSAAFGPFRPHQKHYPITEPAKTLEPRFTIPIAPIFHGNHWKIEDTFEFRKIDPVVPEVLDALVFIPGEHR